MLELRCWTESSMASGVLRLIGRGKALMLAVMGVQLALNKSGAVVVCGG